MTTPIINPASLTEEQKHLLRSHYKTNKCVIADHRKRTGDKAQTRATARIKLYEFIFGEDFFKGENNE